MKVRYVEVAPQKLAEVFDDVLWIALPDFRGSNE